MKNLNTVISDPGVIAALVSYFYPDTTAILAKCGTTTEGNAVIQFIQDKSELQLVFCDDGVLLREIDIEVENGEKTRKISTLAVPFVLIDILRGYGYGPAVEEVKRNNLVSDN